MAKATSAIALLLLSRVSSFTPPSSLTRSKQQYIQHSFQRPTSSSCHHRPTSLRSTSSNDDDDEDDGMLSDELETVVGGNWMKRSTSIDFMPAEMKNSAGDDDSVYMDVGINGETFGTGELSRRMHEAMMKVAMNKFPKGIPEELGDVYLLYSMDASAKEAVKVAMDSNGYALNLGDLEAMQDEGAWGQIDNVVLMDPTTGEPTKGEDGSDSYNSFMEAITDGGWEPGEGFNFVVREVPGRKKAMDLEALLKALDPDGTMWEEAKEKGIMMPGDDVSSLKELGNDCEQRVKSAPLEATDEFNAFRGGTTKGYNVMSRSALLKGNRNADGTENQKTLMHVMDSLCNHGCLIVDMTDEDTATNDATKMSKMWETTTAFFDKVINDENAVNTIPPMQQAEGVGSSHAMVGFASFKDGENQFLETRIRRSDGALLPEETSSIVGEDGAKSMVDAFNVMSEIGKDIVRIATAASSAEADAFLTAGSVVSQEEEGSPSIAGLSFEEASVSGIVEEEGGDPSEGDIQRAEILASDAAILLTEEIMDDGKPLQGGEIEHNEGPVSMSPHRMCRYSNNDKSSKKKASEIFGAHTDTSFVTIVPAAKVSGLEVLDEDCQQWYRPELNARQHAKRLDPTGSMDAQFPWHSRYLIVMPGELLQLTSRNNIPAAVHRVVATTDTPRLSAPVLLRARPGTKMDVERYMGGLGKADSLLLESNGMKM
eukprot:CAMPEP_0202030562 /NCGR_PEP_ID=MMETSP0905-20130828/64560_1 /ASSEMBLY_ACC=CAM_ASM_000554 /TAXON_ID=420261 /ORGANISM="Thalassiosira antarctica, Strain CCMP982" /LENGTH=711 /DNA_ID=CAMNT_0048594365 /DNA_START=66 /DNA_END=2198 /DNA_ORIENTATION=+